MVKLVYLLQAAACLFLYGLLRIIPLDAASSFGGWVARTIGSRLKVHKTAHANLALAMPELSQEERERIITGMWDNLGRTAAEMSRLPSGALLKRTEFTGEENLPAPGSQVLFFSGHMGNWDINYSFVHQRGHRIAIAYRRANNPYVDKIVTHLRSTQSTSQFAKGPRGAVGLVRAIKDRQSLALLVDQKMNDGIPVPFFGRDAMTAPAVAQFALRYNLPIIPARCIRTKGAHFKLIAYPPLTFERTGNEEKDILAIMTAINAMLESWIRECPEQWFWVHKRWPKA